MSFVMSAPEPVEKLGRLACAVWIYQGNHGGSSGECAAFEEVEWDMVCVVWRGPIEH